MVDADYITICVNGKNNNVELDEELTDLDDTYTRLRVCLLSVKDQSAMDLEEEMTSPELAVAHSVSNAAQSRTGCILVQTS